MIFTFGTWGCEGVRGSQADCRTVPGTGDLPQRRATGVDHPVAPRRGPRGSGPVPAPVRRRVGHAADVRVPAGGPPAVAGTRSAAAESRAAAGSAAVHGDRRRRRPDAAGRTVAGR